MNAICVGNFLIRKIIISNYEKQSFKCEICNKKFSQKGYLNNNIKTVYEIQKSQVCLKCCKEFAKNQILIITFLPIPGRTAFFFQKKQKII